MEKFNKLISTEPIRKHNKLSISFSLQRALYVRVATYVS